MTSDVILARLRKIGILPTFPYIVSGVASVIEDPMSSASDLARHMDPSMVGEVLRIANTAYFGTRNFRQITTIERAIAVIGYDHLAHVLLQMPFLSMVQGTDKTFDRRGFVKHAITCGVVSKVMSSALRMGNPNEVFISGIMHDIGMIIIYRYFQGAWQKILSLVAERGISRVDAEREVLSADHGYVGAALLEMWNIPKPITDAVMFHHCPEQAPDNTENATATYLGNMFSKGVDFMADLQSFDDFLARHRYVTEVASRFGREFSAKGEIEFVERIFSSLSSIRNYIQEVVDSNGDQSPGS
jgi:HD-like signal output (HDOD) protein